MKTQTPVLVSNEYRDYWKQDVILYSRSYACTEVLERLYPETATAKRIVIHCASEEDIDEQMCILVFYDAIYAEISDQDGELVHNGFIMYLMRAVFHELESNANRFGFWVEVIE